MFVGLTQWHIDCSMNHRSTLMPAAFWKAASSKSKFRAVQVVGSESTHH